MKYALAGKLKVEYTAFGLAANFSAVNPCLSNAAGNPPGADQPITPIWLKRLLMLACNCNLEVKLYPKFKFV